MSSHTEAAEIMLSYNGTCTSPWKNGIGCCLCGQPAEACWHYFTHDPRDDECAVCAACAQRLAPDVVSQWVEIQVETLTSR